jgi:hypothetical protein
MGYVTQTRNTTGAKYRQKYFGQPDWVSGDIHDLVVPQAKQTTTSFRTGMRSDGDLQESEDFGSNRREFYSKLKSDYDRGPQSDYDTGHEFESTRQWLTVPRSYDLYNVAAQARYSGPILAPGVSFGGNYPAVPATESLGYYGPAAIKRTIPTSPHVSITTALAELRREGLPAIPGVHLLKDRLAHFRELGGEYLNLEFGWKPLANDFMSTVGAIREAGRLLDQYQRDSGRLVRRKTVFPDIRSIQVADPRPGVALQGPPGFGLNNFRAMFVGSSATGTLYESTESVTRTWFSGAWTYYCQDDNNVLNSFRLFANKVNYLFGIEVTPEVLWNLAPWSWLSDWYVNIGDNIANASRLQADGLVMKYGYLMQETVTKHTCLVTGPVLKTGEGSGGFLTTYCSSRKVRKKATPYGFGSNPASFTGRQWAILSALGFARGTGQLSHGD